MTSYAFYDFKFGILKIGHQENTITYIKKVINIDNENNPTALTDNVYKQLNEYLIGQRQTFDINFKFHGTPFQNQVWSALCNIPYGETRSYKDIAIAINNPKACRAVGMANNKNPISIVVPCHRVIGASGKLVGYACGLEMKKSLLDLELSNK